MSNSLFSSYGRVTIYDRHLKKKYDLWNSGEENSYPFVTEIDMEIQFGQVSKVSFSINAPVKEGVEMLNSDMFLAGNLVTSELGYHNGKSTSLYPGLLKDGGLGLKLDSGGLTGQVSVVFSTPASLFSRSKESTTEDMESLVRVLANECGYEVDISSEAITNFDNQDIVSINSILSTFDFMKLLIFKANNEFFIKFSSTGKPIIDIGVFNNSRQSLTKRTLEFMGRFDPTNNIYPLLSFAPSDYIHLFAPRGASTKVKASRINKKGVVETVSSQAVKDTSKKSGNNRIEGEKNSTTKAKKITVKTDSKIDKDQAGKVFGAKSRNSKDSIQKEITMLQQTSRLEDGLKSDCETIGIPDIIPGEEIDITNSGKLFNGKYTVRIVKHKWNGAFSTSLTVIRATLKNQKSKRK